MQENSLLENRLEEVARLLRALGISERWSRDIKEYAAQLERSRLRPTKYEVLIAATYLVLKRGGEIVSIKELIKRLDRELGKRVSHRKIHRLVTRSQGEEPEEELADEMDPLERYLALKTGIIRDEAHLEDTDVSM